MYCPLTLPPQVAPSQQNGVCIPQKRYEMDAGCDLLDNQRLVLFIQEDGSYIPVPAAVGEDYTSLVCCDLPAFGEAGFTITLQFEVGRMCHHWWCTGIHCCTVARVSTPRFPGGLTHISHHEESETQNFSCGLS